MNWRDYHQATKHSVESLRRTRHILDWANMPNPFRHYEGAPVLDLPADPPPPGAPTDAGPVFLSQLLFYSAAISASKLVPATGDRYALRVNPSSGNLHPTEFHYLTRGLKDWPDGLYHYRPSSHMAEQRAQGTLDFKWSGGAPIVFVLTSIAWREAWKYRDRAYRYCLHDIGHAWQALALAGRAMGCDTFARGCFPDEEVAQCCRFPADEWPMLILELSGSSIPLREPDASETTWYGGQANQLSREVIAYRSIHAIHAATKLTPAASSAAGPAPTGSGEIPLPPPALSHRAFGDVVRGRRSALDFEGGRARSPSRNSPPSCSPQPNRCSPISLRRVLSRLIYTFTVPMVCRPASTGTRPIPPRWKAIKTGDQRVAAAGLSLGQDLAGNACVAFSMIGDLERAVRAYADRGYRYVHFEAGAIGHRMYLAAEALGLGATGIGAFDDDEVHRYLNLTPEQGQVVYHFAIGYPIPDPRLNA